MYTLLTYEDSDKKTKTVRADDLKGTIEIHADGTIVNTTKLDIVKIVSAERIED